MGVEKGAGVDHWPPVNVVDVDHFEAAGDMASARRPAQAEPATGNDASGPDDFKQAAGGEFAKRFARPGQVLGTSVEASGLNPEPRAHSAACSGNINRRNQLGTEVIAEAWHSLVVPANGASASALAAAVEANSDHGRLAASRRARTVSQSSSSAVPASI